MNAVHSILVPQLNVNDETVTFVEWSVPHGTFVDKDTPISVVETSKAANELCAECSGVLYHLVVPVKKVSVGEELGLIGPSLAEIERFLAVRRYPAFEARQAESGWPPATPRARQLMSEHGIGEREVLSLGIQGSIKEKDVLAYLRMKETHAETVRAPSHPASTLPPAIRMLVEDLGMLPDHEAAVADVLSVSRQSLLLTTAELVIELSPINRFLARVRAEGSMVTLLHCIIGAAARALKAFPRLRSIYHQHTVYCYTDCAIGFVVKSLDGGLYTPVIRNADALPLHEIARSCHALTMKINRGSVQESDLAGACFTISHIAQPVLHSFRALPNLYQSAVLAVAGERTIVQLLEGVFSEAPVCTLTLSYDHALCDGMYAADFLHALAVELNRLTHE